MPVMKKVKLEKKTRKHFDQRTVVIQTPSFTTLTDYGYFILLCNFPLSKTNIFKISETLPKRFTYFENTLLLWYSGWPIHDVGYTMDRLTTVP